MTNNRTDGYLFYLEGGPKCRDWVHRQWVAWPERVDPNKTTNGSFLYGALLAYRELNDHDPEMSQQYCGWVDVMDVIGDDG